MKANMEKKEQKNKEPTNLEKPKHPNIEQEASSQNQQQSDKYRE